MGKGDRKTRKGKIVKGTYGVSRPRPSNTANKPGESKKKTSGKKSAKEKSAKK